MFHVCVIDSIIHVSLAKISNFYVNAVNIAGILFHNQTRIDMFRLSYMFPKQVILKLCIWRPFPTYITYAADEFERISAMNKIIIIELSWKDSGKRRNCSCLQKAHAAQTAESVCMWEKVKATWVCYRGIQQNTLEIKRKEFWLIHLYKQKECE